MPKIVDPAVQRGDIRSAARRVFARRGLRGTGLAHVAAEAGMSRSSLYHYYADKDALRGDLLDELLAGELSLFREQLRADGRAIERLEGLARACAAAMPSWVQLGRLGLDLRLEDSHRLRAYFRTLRHDVAEVIAAGQAEGCIAPDLEPEALASFWIAAIDGLLLQYVVDAEALPSAHELAEHVATLTRRMVAP